MGKLPTIKKVLNEDIKSLPNEIKQGIQPIINTINNFMEVVYQNFNKNVTFEQNVACFVKEIVYKTPSTYPTMENVEFGSELKSKASGLMLVQALVRGTYVPVTTAVYVPWVENNGVIVIYPIVGLQADTTYTIRLLIF